MNNESKLSTVAVLAAVAAMLLSAALVVLPIQEVDARKQITITNTAKNRCTGPGTTCLAGAQQTIIIGSTGGGPGRD